MCIYIYHDNYKRIRGGICPDIEAEAKDGRKAQEAGAYVRSGRCAVGGENR